jgi:isoprenylcysteine carboxyl methyltransferase (ICMT) family protein YpbQ
VTARGIPSARKVPSGTCDRHSISASANQAGSFLWVLTCTLGDFCVKVIVTISHFFIDDLISRLRKILTYFLHVIRELFACTYLVGTLVVSTL